MVSYERFFVLGDSSDFNRYHATVWRKNAKGVRLMRLVSWYPKSGKLHDTLANGKYQDKDTATLEDFKKILRQYKGRGGWFVLDESQSITDFVD